MLLLIFLNKRGVGSNPAASATAYGVTAALRYTHLITFSDLFGSLVELVTMSPCHGEGHGFESRTSRQLDDERVPYEYANWDTARTQ